MPSPQRKSFLMYYFKLGFLLFWAGWFTIAFRSNLLDLLYLFTGWPLNYEFKSNNYSLLSDILNHFHVPTTYTNILFVCDVISDAISAILFFIAAIYWVRKKYVWQTTHWAFAISMGLWAVFILVEEIFLAYTYETIQIRLFMFELLTLLSMHLLPD